MVTEVQSQKRRVKLKQELANVKVPEPQSFWDRVKAFFSYSATLVVARFTALTGLISAVVSSLDWSPFLSLNIDTGLSKNQVIWMGGVAFIQGLITELARRRTLVG